MPRLVPLLALALGMPLAPACARDAIADTGRRAVLDSLDVDGSVQAHGLNVSGASRIGGIMTFDDTRVPILKVYDAPLDNVILFSPGGARISMASRGGHDRNGKYGPDSFRAQTVMRATSQADAGIEETTAIIEHRGVTGYSPPWYPNYRYPAGTQITGGRGFIFETRTACTTANAKPSADRPGDPNPPQTDGSCMWHYVGIGAGNNKTPLLIYGSIEEPQNGLPGGGQGWAQAMIIDVKTGAWPLGGGFAVGQEIDVGNGKGDCRPSVPNGCQIYGSFINGNGLYKSTVGAFYGGEKGFHVGILLSSTAGSDIGISNASNAQTGYYDNGTHDIAAITDESTSPFGIRLNGTYRSAQITGHGWGVDPKGALTAATVRTGSLNTALSTPASSKAPCQAGDWAHDASFVYTCVAANTWKRSPLSSW